MKKKTLLKRGWPIVLLICFQSLILCPVCESQERIDIEEWFHHAKVLLEKTDSYTAVFHKQERIKGTLKTRETVELKFKKPFMVYMRWIDGPGIGREVYYVPGWNDNRMLVREPALRGTVTLNLHPKSPLAMQGSRHPITEAGLEFLIKLFGENLRRGWESGELEYRMVREEWLYGRKTILMEIRFPREPRNHYYCHRSLLNFDIETKIPIRVQVFDWENRLIGDYGYENLRINAGLSDADFEPQNRR